MPTNPVSKRRPVAVVVADAHVHPHGAHNAYDSHGRSSRVQRTMEALEDSFQWADENDCVWISAGDLLHTKGHLPYEIVDPLVEVFDRYAHVMKILLVGNHERPDRFTETNILGWLPDAHVVNTPEQMQVGPLQIMFVPWYSDHAMIVQGFQQGAANHAPMVIGHCGINDALMDNGRPYSGSLTSEQLQLDRFRLALFGDFHGRQQIGPTAHYVGALVQQNYGERENPQGFAVVYDDYSVEWCNVDVKQFAYVDDPADVGSSESFTKLNPATAATQALAEVTDDDGVQLVVDTGSLQDFRSLAQAYAREFPPPEDVSAEAAVNAAVAFLEQTS